MTMTMIIKPLIRQYRTVNKALAAVVISQNLHEILLGLVLGNAHIERPSPNHNSRLTIKQSVSNLKYVQYLFNLLSKFCGSKYKSHIGQDKRPDRAPIESSKFNTLSVPQLNVYRERFYGPEGTKVVPENIKSDFTECSLAHWYMDCGHKAHGGYWLPVTKFTAIDRLRLLDLLVAKFSLVCELRNNYIFIKTLPDDVFLELVKPHIISHFEDKLYI